MPGSGRRTLYISICLIALIETGASARPWWWAQFTLGDGVNNTNSGFERWEAFVANQGTSNADTTYVCSYTWGGGAGNIGTINGINAGNTAGLNKHSAAGYPADYLIGDGDGSPNWDTAQLISDADVTDVTEPAAGDIMHIKDIFVENRGYLVSSANMTAGGFRSQYNNAIWFPWAGMSTGMRAKVRDQMVEMAGGTFHDATQYGTIDFYSPNGDRIELRYAPEDNDGGSAAGAGSTLSRFREIVAGVTQSIFFLSDAWSSSVGTDALRDDITAKTGIIWRGCVGDGGDVDATTKTNFEGDANGTLRDQAGAFNRLHSKTFIFDMDTVATGSPNMTATAMYSASPSNDEVSVIINDFRLARRYMTHYWQVMDSATADPSADAFDKTAPAGASGLAVSATDTAFYPSWTASATADVVRYYLFIDTAAFTQAKVGDRLDQDGDGYYDEDPPGDYDGFMSGSTAADSKARDDDADGTADEDSWFPPEVRVNGRASTAGAITSWNVGDSLLAATNYYFAIVSVDTQGNEGAIATAGPVQLNVNDTRLRVVMNSDVGDSSVPRGNTNVVVAKLWVRGGDTTLQDTLSIFAVKNLGTADSRDVQVRLWRDENRDSAVTPGVDTLVSTLRYNNVLSRWDDTALAADSRTFLGSGTAGRSYLVALDIPNTSTVARTFQARVVLQTCSAVRSNSGPISSVDNAGTATIVSSNPVDVLKIDGLSSSAIAKGAVDSPVMTVRFTVGSANDTVQVFSVKNDGTMTSSDVDVIRLYQDGDGDSVIDAGPTDTFVAALAWNAAASAWKADTIAYRFSGTSCTMIVALSVSAGASANRTFQARIPAYGCDAVTADSGPTTDRTTSAVYTIPSDTSPDTAVVVNEFYSSPNTTAPPNHDNDGYTGGADEEYIELYNNSDGPVDVGGWGLNDSGSLAAFDVTFPAGLVMGAREYLVCYPDTIATQPQWRLMDSAGAAVVDSGRYSAGTFPGINNNADVIYLRKDLGTYIDTSPMGGGAAYTSTQRLIDGWSTWETNAATCGTNDDPSNFDSPSANGGILVTASSSTVFEGESFTLTMTVRDADKATVTAFTLTADLAANTGTAAPAATGSFAAGVRSESTSVSGILANCSVVLTARYNQTTWGSCTITVRKVTPPDTSIVVLENSDTPSRSVGKGETNVVVATLWIRGETTATGDTLVLLRVANLGLADTADLVLRLWRDENADSLVTPGVDTLAATCTSYAAASRAYVFFLSSDSATRLGAGASAGKTFLVAADVYDTATTGETFQASVAVQTCSAVRSDSGPDTALTNAGVFTIVPSNPVDVLKIDGLASAAIHKGAVDSPIMTVRFTVGVANDTVQVFSVKNDGTMTSSDVDVVRLYQDGDGDSVIDAGPTDTFVAALGWNAAASAWKADTIAYPFPGTSCTMIVALSVSPSATGQRTFQARVPANGCDAVVAETGPTADRTTGAVFTIPSDTPADTAIVINELLADPGAGGPDHDSDGLVADGDEEFVELYNNSDGSVDVGGWDLDDDLVPGDATLPVGLVLGPRQFLIVYADTDAALKTWYRYDSAGRTVLDSGTYAGAWPAINHTVPVDTIVLSNALNAQVDSVILPGVATVNRSWARLWDGAAANTSIVRPTPGVNADPNPLYNNPSPNARFVLTANPTAISEIETTTITITVKDEDSNTLTSFTQTADLSANTGTINLSTTGAFAAGIRNESVSISGVFASCSAVVIARYNQTTWGSCTITVQNLTTVVCTVALEARADASGCTGYLFGGSYHDTRVSNAAGVMTFPNVPTGTYTFTGKEFHHLRTTTTGINVTGDTTVGIGTLLAGDSNDDNWISIFDAARTKWFRSAGYNWPCDMDNDADVDDTDLQRIRTNFNLRGDN